MAITTAVISNFEKLTGKTLSVQSILTSKIKEAYVTVTYGASDNYTTGGDTVDLSLGGRIKTIIAAQIISNDKGVVIEYVPASLDAAATGKLKCYSHEPTSGTAGVPALSQLASGSTVVNSMVVKIRVVGF